MTEKQVHRLSRELQKFLDEIAEDFGRRGRREWGERYLRGLLLDGERKSIEPMANRLSAIENHEIDYEQGLQQFISQSPWEHQRLKWNLGAMLGREFRGIRDAYLVVDDTGFLKQGKHSVGVYRQYTGSAGKITNCQVGVSLLVGTEQRSCACDMELYLSEDWIADKVRRKKAGIPQEVSFATKPELALEMIRRAKQHGLFHTVLADAGYGDSTEFRKQLDAEGLHYCVGISSQLGVIDASTDFGTIPQRQTMGRPPTRPKKLRERKIGGMSVLKWAEQHCSDFREVSWRRTGSRALSGRFAAWRIRPAHGLSTGKMPLEECWLLVEWPSHEAQPTRYFFSSLPKRTSLRKLVRTAKARWIIEQQYREMKDELGLDHFEGRSWIGWHHHVTMTMLAYAFISLRVRELKKTSRQSRNSAKPYRKHSYSTAVTARSALRSFGRMAPEDNT